MYLNQAIAYEIIKEISPVVNMDLNIMDGTGRILASTNSERVDTHHEGAHILIQKNLPEFIVETDGAYQGCKKGVNLPIHFAHEVVGVIGLTGEPQETIQYGRIIQRMTEMILFENFEESKRNADDQAKLLFLSDLIHGNYDTSFFQIEKQLAEYGLKVNGPFSVATFRLNTEKEENNPALSQAKQAVMNKSVIGFLAAHHILTAYNGEFYIALSNLSDEELFKMIRKLAEDIEKQYQVFLLGTIGNEYQNYTDISKSYQEAASISSYFEGQKAGLYLFQNIMLDFIINQIPTIHKKNLYNQMFKNCEKSEVEEYKDFISAYFNCDGSLTALAEKYFVHKNTIQYRISKIAKKTGFDMRIPHDLFILYIATNAKF